MATTRDDIRDSLYNGKGKGYSHMIMVCDTFDYEDYPVFVQEGEDIQEYIRKYQNYQSMSKIMEIYNYSMDLEPQLRENRAYHIEVSKQEEKKKEVKPLERLEKLPGYQNSYSVGKVKINDLSCIPFDKMGKLPSDMNGYIDHDGNFYPAISISSTNYNYGHDKNITMNQFAVAFLNEQDESVRAHCKQSLTDAREKGEIKNVYDVLDFASSYIVENLGYASFYRYIDASEYGITQEYSRLPENASYQQLIMMQQLFTVNHNGSTRIIEKGAEYAKILAKKIGAKN